MWCATNTVPMHTEYLPASRQIRRAEYDHWRASMNYDIYFLLSVSTIIDQNMDDSKLPPPFVVPFSSWDGNDGRWSTLSVRIGSPEQIFRVLPSTASQKIIVPVPEGCIEDDPVNCGELRGADSFDGHQSKGFQYNRSSTWSYIGLYSLGLESHLNYTGAALYGLDSAGLAASNSSTVTLPQQVVGGVATKDYYLGHFGLDERPTNFSSDQNPQPSFLRSLRNKEKIPSMSYGYTAGASYQTPRIPGNVVLGGYDASRRKGNAVSFPFNTDESRLLSLTIQSIDTMNSPLGTVTLYDTPIYVNIDSTVSHIWLPRNACDRFEQVFGLQYDPSTDLYLVNTTTRDRLKQLNPSINFQLGASRDPRNVVNINLPYGAFDLQATHPLYPNATNYFPIRRAANETQLTLGRTFLQESYLITDYENRNFSIAQAAFEYPLKEHIISIVSKDYSRSSNQHEGPSGHKSRLVKSEIVGIALGAAAFLLLVATAFYYYLKRRKRLAKSDTSRDMEKPRSLEYPTDCVEVTGVQTHEVDAFPVVKELSHTPIYEIEGWEAPEVKGDLPHQCAHELST